MATIYFTNTNAAGDGTLYNAVQKASVGDVVSPDPAVFGVGERVVITLAAELRIPVALTIDAGGTRLILTCANGGVIDCRDSTGFNDFDAHGVAFVGRVLVGGDSATSLNCNFYKCVFKSSIETRHSLHCMGYANLKAYDCAFICGAGNGFYAANTSATYTFTRSSFAANKKNDATAGRLAATYIDCIDEPDLATAGFANVPASLDEVDVAKWEEYDFAPLPSSPFATGGTTGAGETDLLGNKRGWTDESGSTQYAVGAYEVVKADYFLSKDTLPSARFTEPSTWKATRGGDVTPEVVGAGVFYVDETKTFIDAPPAGASIVVAGPSRVEIGDSCVLDEIRAGARSTIAFKSAVAASAFDLRGESTVEIRQDDVVVLDSLTYGAGVSMKSTGRAYLSAPGVDASAFELENVVIGQRGAKLSGFYVDRKSSNTLDFTWTSKNPSVPIVIEQRVDDSWTTFATASGTSASFGDFGESFAINYGNWRAWDGDAFFFSTPPWSKTDFFRYWNGVETTVSASEWAITTYTVRANDMGYRNENALFLALIKNPLTGKLLTPDEVENITATLYKVGGWAAPNEWAAVEAWTSVPVPVDSVLYTPIDPATLTGAGLTWTKEEGPNFSWAPTTTENVLFSENGSYVMQVKFVLKGGKNPIVATFSAKAS